MGIRKTAAEAASAVSTAALQRVFRRPAGNFPGKMALYIDPAIIAEQASKLASGSFCVVGTNGKTTITNILADCLEAAGQRVVCNRTGANLDSGIATSLLHSQEADWGVFECDELWLVKILPHLQSRYVILTNLFHDQLDRVGEVEYIQNSIISALEGSPETTLIYNADDPYCEKVAQSVSNPNIPFGMGEEFDLPYAASSHAQICECCDSLLEYSFHVYSQLGKYSCPSCDFARPHLKFSARNIALDASGMRFDVVAATDEDAVAGGPIAQVKAPYTGAYMVYNLLAYYTACHLVGLSNHVIQLTIDGYHPQNGRLEAMTVHGHDVLLNLAKNPTGFNQNLSLVLQESGPVAVAFFVNDKEGDGRDVSWLWDVSFEQLAGRGNTRVFAGGMRANELQVRLKYAGVPADVVSSAHEVMRKVAALSPECKVFFIANYTSLPEVRDECAAMAKDATQPIPLNEDVREVVPLPNPEPSGDALRIVHLYPDLLNQGGDSGNVAVLAKRCQWRGIPVTVQHVSYGQEPDLESADIVVLGDGFDREQRIACEQMAAYRDELAAYVARGGVLLAVDGGLQVLGKSFSIGKEEFAGLGVLDIANGRTENDERIVGDIVVETELVDLLVVGFENHAGITHLGEGAPAFGTVLKGVGNNAGDSTEGVRKDNLVGTYVHGPVLAKSPELADWLLTQAFGTRGEVRELAPLDDTSERNAREFMLKRLGV